MKLIIGEIAMEGTEVAEKAAQFKTDQERQRFLLDEILAGNLPDSTLAWKRVRFTANDTQGNFHDVEVDVAPDYLAVGSDEDKIIAPLGLTFALAAGKALGFTLPTPALVDRIWQAADAQIPPAPLPATTDSTMRKPPYWLASRDRIPRVASNALAAGHKKDVVFSKMLIDQPSRLVIYGWHKPDGKVIQGPSTFHGADYADYSHGVRPIHPTLYVDGEPLAYREVLRDPVLHKLISREAPFDIDRIRPPGGWTMV